MQTLQKLLLIALALCLCLTACGQKAPALPAETPDVPLPAETPAAPSAEEPAEEPAEPEPSGPIAEGDPYRDFTAVLTDGSSFTLSDHEGKVILLNFWATWCGPCVGEMPAFPRLIDRYGEDLVLVAVNCGESADTVTAFLEKNGYTFPVVADETYEIRDKYPSDGIPYTVIIAPSGTVSLIMPGAADADTMFQFYSSVIDLILS